MSKDGIGKLKGKNGYNSGDRGNGHPEPRTSKGKHDTSSRTLDSRSRVQRLLSVKEASLYLGISTWTIRSLGWNGEIPEVKIGRRVLFDREDLDRFIENSKRR